MRLLVCSIVIALWALPLPRAKTLPLAAALPAQAAHRALAYPATWEHSLTKRSLAPAEASASALVAPVRGLDVVAAEGETTQAPAAANGDEATTEEPYDSGGDEGGDFGADILNTLLEVIGTLLSFFSDPPGAIQKMVEQAQKLTGAARSLMATGPAGARAARGLLEEAKRILETARGLVEAGGSVATKARNVVESLSRPFKG